MSSSNIPLDQLQLYVVRGSNPDDLDVVDQHGRKVMNAMVVALGDEPSEDDDLADAVVYFAISAERYRSLRT